MRSTVWESQSNVEIISEPASHRRVEILRQGTQYILWKKTLWFHFSGLGDFITYRRSGVLKLFEVRATSHDGDENKEKTKQKPPMHHSSKGVILESPCMGGLSIWLNFHLKSRKCPLHRNAYFIFEY